MQNLPISLVIITLDEAANLERCIRSAPFVDEVIVVDSMSNDGTPELAQRLGARVIQQSWLGYGPQKNKGAEAARNDWILSLDADEACSEELRNEIEALSLDGSLISAYDMPRKSFHLGRWICHGGWFPDRQLRLYDRRRAHWSESVVHEKVQAPSIAHLKNPLLHWVFESLSDQINTNNKYSTLGALELHRRGQKFTVIKLFLKPFSKFLETYFFKCGFLDGLPGLIIAVGASYSVFLKFAKLWELQRGNVT